MTTIDVPQAVIDRLDRRFQEHRELIPVLQQRAEPEDIESVCTLEDLVPLLFPHTDSMTSVVLGPFVSDVSSSSPLQAARTTATRAIATSTCGCPRRRAL